MRGPLGSLIAQARQELFQKALPPSLFAERWRTLGSACRMPVGAGLARNVGIRPSGSRQSVYRLTRSSAGCVLLRQSTPFAIRSDSSPYLFGYRIMEQLHFGNEFGAEL